jgi:hypothetical protein
MEEPRAADPSFTLGWCAICSREVLTYTDYDAAQREERRCVHCEQLVQHKLRAAPVSELPSNGYGLLELQGCGNPNCGGGQCARQQNE